MSEAPLSLWRHDSGDFAAAERGRTMAEIVRDVAERHLLTPELLRGHRQGKELSAARHEAMHLMMETGRFSSPQVGRFLGGRDHTTILYGVRRHKERNAYNHGGQSTEAPSQITSQGVD